MIHGGNSDNIDNRERRHKAMADNGHCTHCKPNRGENEGKRDGKWLYDSETMSATFRASKPKDRK